MLSIDTQYAYIHAVASDCSSVPATGRCDRSKALRLSRPRNPPENRSLPSESSRFNHHVKFSSSLWKTRSRNSVSRRPSIFQTASAASACTGGFTSSNDHSYAGRAPLGCWNHSRHMTSNWYLANAGSTWARVIAWNARSHAANHGYSHLSGIDRMSAASKWRQPALRPVSRSVGGGFVDRIAVEPAADVVGVELLAPEHPGERLAHDHRLVVGRVRPAQVRVERVRLGRAGGQHLRRTLDPRRSMPLAFLAPGRSPAAEGAGAAGSRRSRRARRSGDTRPLPSSPSRRG